jgi:hypothetical protein
MTEQRFSGEWNRRLVRGLTGTSANDDSADALVAALGALGCEAEYALNILHTPARMPQPTHVQAENWLQHCYHLGQRVAHLAADFDVAAQAYLAALVASDPSVGRDDEYNPNRQYPHDPWSARFDATPNVWWPEQGAVAVHVESIAFWLRRGGYAYRHCISLGLPEHIEALTDTLGLVLHALQTLPPGGIISRISLYMGVQHLLADISGDLVPHHIRDIDARHVGLLTGIATLARLSDGNQASITTDIAWARGELERARATLNSNGTQGVGRITRPLATRTGNLWANQIVAEWERTVAQLEALRASESFA